MIDAAELDREHAARRFTCPVCRRGPGNRCWYGLNRNPDVAHTGRYLRAVDAGLVPAFPGGWRP